MSQAGIQAIQESVKALVQNDEAREKRELEREVREVRTSILETQTQACRSSGELRIALTNQVGQLRSQYMALTGGEFPPTPCGDLIGG